MSLITQVLNAFIVKIQYSIMMVHSQAVLSQKTLNRNTNTVTTRLIITMVVPLVVTIIVIMLLILQDFFFLLTTLRMVLGKAMKSVYLLTKN